MMMHHNHPAPPLLRADTYGRQWVGVPQNVLRLTTIRLNPGRRP